MKTLDQDLTEHDSSNGRLSMFAVESNFYRTLLFTGMIIALLKGLRLPSAWPATQAQIDYRYGFLRRGLFGEVCRHLHLAIWHYSVFTAVSFSLLAIFLFLLGYCVRRSGLDALALGSFSTLVAGSFCVSMMVGLVGYFDIIMATLVLLVLLIPNPRLQLVAAAIAGIIGVLVHELYAVAFLPASLAGAICWASESDERREEGNRQAWQRWAAVAIAALLPGILVFAIARHADLSSAQAKELLTSIHSRVDFQPYNEMLDVLTRSGSDNLHLMLQYVRLADAWVEETFCMLAFLPTTCFLLAVSFRMAAGRPRIVKAWLLICTFSPLLLDFQGFDYYRWAVLMELNSLFCVLACCFAYSRQRENKSAISLFSASSSKCFSSSWRRVAVLLLAVNLATNVGFLDHPGKSFPFREYAIDIHALLKSHRPIMRPERLFPGGTLNK